MATSVITEVELARALQWAASDGGPALDEASVRTITAALVELELTPAIRRVAATLELATLRSLDATNVATAMSLGPELGGVLTYDSRMQDAVSGLGLAVGTPV